MNKEGKVESEEETKVFFSDLKEGKLQVNSFNTKEPILYVRGDYERETVWGGSSSLIYGYSFPYFSESKSFSKDGEEEEKGGKGKDKEVGKEASLSKEEKPSNSNSSSSSSSSCTSGKVGDLKYLLNSPNLSSLYVDPLGFVLGGRGEGVLSYWDTSKLEPKTLENSNFSPSL